MQNLSQNLFYKKKEDVICNDLHPYLIAMYQALQNGYDLPEDISIDIFVSIRTRTRH